MPACAAAVRRERRAETNLATGFLTVQPERERMANSPTFHEEQHLVAKFGLTTDASHAELA